MTDKTPKHYDRRLGIVAAQNYLLQKYPCAGTVKAIEDMGAASARFLCLHGIKLPTYKRHLKNALGKKLPSISC